MIAKEKEVFPMKKNIPILLLCFVLSFALMGCGRGEKQTTRYALNPDGTLNQLRWGMTFAQAAQAEKGIAKDNDQTQTQLEQGKDEGSELIVSLPPGELLGIWAQVLELRFCRLPEEGNDAPLRLTDIRILAGPEAEREDLATQAESALTMLEKEGYSSWKSADTLGAHVTGEALKKVHPNWSEGTIMGALDMPLYSASVSFAEYNYKCLSTSGLYKVLTEVLGQ